jgi:N4-gp56 family major capsid protein
MGVLTSSSVVAPAVTSWFNKDLLVRATPMLVHGRVAQRKPLKGRAGNTIVFRRFNALSLATTPLVEGVTPAGKSLSNTDISSAIKQYGDYITVSDLVQAIIESDILREGNRVLAEQTGQTLDALMRDAFVAGTSVFYGGAVAGRSSLVGTSQKVTTALLDRVNRYFGQQNAHYFTEMVDATDHVDTHPIRPAVWAITTPEVLFTLETLTGWVPSSNYASSGPVQEAEAGAYKNIRFLISTLAKSYAGGGGTASGDVKSTSSNADVHTILFFAKDAVGTVPLDNMSLENIIHPKGSAGPADPLNQIGTMGWKRAGTELILNDNFMTRAEVTVGDSAP